MKIFRPFLVHACAAPAALALATLLAACAIAPYTPTNVHPGDSQEDVLRVMGPPTATYTMADGHRRLEYNRLPAGRHTYMIDLDAQGRVAHWENVLDENHFAAIVAGMTREDVLRLIGPPTFTSRYSRPTPGITWLYRFETIQHCTLFEVAFDAATGRVLEGDYPPDPGCGEYRG
jgi:outer membrane protein assembly factor BamE (lipoprotein component of BamABCDE complex)